MVEKRVRHGFFRLARCWVLGAMIAGAAGCSSTMVVLVPDPGGKVGEVSVTTDSGTRVLTVAGESTTATYSDSPPDETKVLDDEYIVRVFGPALDNEPLPPERFTLYFHFDTTDLTPESREMLPTVRLEAGKRQVCDVSVNGHTDRMGTAEYNRHLSMQRAKRVQQELIELGLDPPCLNIRYYGESDPLVPTQDGVAKRVNRRVEIEVR